MKHNRNYEILIEETSQRQLYKKSMENIRLTQLKAKADLEAELDYQKKYIGSPMINKAKYYQQIGEGFMASKRLVLSLF